MTWQGFFAADHPAGRAVARLLSTGGMVCAPGAFFSFFPNLDPGVNREITKDCTMEYHIYEDEAGEWRWQLLAANSKVLADSGEGYKNKSDCLRGIQLVKNSENAPIYEHG